MKPYSYRSPFSKNKSHLTYPNFLARTHAHARVLKHTIEQHCTCLRGNIFRVSYSVFLLPYETFVNCSCKFPHETVEIVLLKLRRQALKFT